MILPITGTSAALRDSLFEMARATMQSHSLDFVPGLDHEAAIASNIKKSLDVSDSNNLSCLIPSKATGKPAYLIACEHLPWDSRFFGYQIARINFACSVGATDKQWPELCDGLSAFTDWLTQKGFRYVFTTVDARDLNLLRAVTTSNQSLIETRLNYHRELLNYEYRERFDTRLATHSDVTSLARAAVEMVNPYDRFHADPFIKIEQADRMMEEWIHASIDKGFADGAIVPNAPSPTAFCTFRVHKEKWDFWKVKLAQPVLSAVSHEYKGWYLKIISELSYHLKASGAEHAYMVTQSTNRAVIHTWEKLGYRFGSCEHIFRKILGA